MSVFGETGPNPLRRATSTLDEWAAVPASPAERPFDSPTIATLSDSVPESVTQHALRHNPIVIHDHGSWLDTWFVQFVVVSISVVLGSFLLALLFLLMVLRRLSLLQNSTIRIELADPGSASLRVLARSLIPNGSGKSDGTISQGGESRVAAAIAGQSEAYQHAWLAGPNPSAPSRPTRVADLADLPFPTELTGPTFEEARQAAEAQRLEQEAEILRNIYDHNLLIVEGLEELRAASAA